MEIRIKLLFKLICSDSQFVNIVDPYCIKNLLERSEAK